jgi:hypothetical protein
MKGKCTFPFEYVSLLIRYCHNEVFAAVRARVRASWGVTRNLRKPSGATEMPSTAVVVLPLSGRDQPLFWAR